MPASERGPYRATDRQWLSVHVPFEGRIYTAACDRVIREVARPLWEEARAGHGATRFFFIRYHDGVPHVRLRLDVPRKEAAGLRQCIERRVSALLPSELRLQQDGETVPPAWVDYAPEVERYGGPDRIGLAEDYFCLSSQVVLDLLEVLDDAPRQTRLARALMLAFVQIHPHVPDRAAAAAFFQDYARRYLRRLDLAAKLPPDGWPTQFEAGFERQQESLVEPFAALWGELGGERALPDPVIEFHDGCRAIAERLTRLGPLAEAPPAVRAPGARRRTVVSAILPSYLHMTHNRLGVSTLEESYLAFLGSRILEGGHRREAARV